CYSTLRFSSEKVGTWNVSACIFKAAANTIFHFEVMQDYMQLYCYQVVGRFTCQ
ncbi:Uncharacterized protein APZ42_004571, partial [Daphnia magna]